LTLKYLLIPILLSSSVMAQEFPADPDSCKLVTSDIDNFWRAFDMMEQGIDGNPFDAHYVRIGSQGVRDFIPYRIQHADTLYKNVLNNPDKYASVRSKTLMITEKEGEIRATFHAMKELYPPATFPPVYFVIGNFNSGGTSSSHGLIIGAETQEDVDNIPHLVAHELIHFQQKTHSFRPNLLEQSLREGTADFIGEMISGNHINEKAFDYGEAHRDMLCREFVEKMRDYEYTDWLYGTSGKDDRPNDLGYWMGYQIAKSFYDKQPDQLQAIEDLLDIRDAEKFLSRSGFLDPYLR
jgi:hypothetical protein